jgi:hypothetical protein
MVDYTGLRDGLLSSFGEPVTVTVSAVLTALTGAFLAPHVGMDLNGAPVNRPDPQLVVRTAEWAATNAQNGNTVTRAAVVYTVVDAQPDDDGLTMVTLRRYA